LLSQFALATDDAIQNQKVEEALTNATHYLAVLQGCYTGLEMENEEWALKLSANLLETNSR
jgi:hypothetical protein